MKLLLLFNLFGIISLSQGFRDECKITEDFRFGSNYSNQCQPSDERQSRFINFKQYGNSVQMELDFVVPFLSIPVNKSLSGLMPSKFGTGLGQLQLNFPSLLLSGVVAVSGALLGSLNKMFANRLNTTVLLQKMLDAKKPKDLYNNLNDIEENFVQYRQRRSEKRREPRFINLKQIGNSVQIELDFVIPFMSIPVNKSIRSVMGSMTPGTTGIGLGQFQINYPALTLAFFVMIAGAMLGAFNKLSKNQVFAGPLLNRIFGKTNYKSNEQYQWIMGIIDKVLDKYKLDSTTCSQKVVCWYIKESKYKVQKNRGNKFEKFVNGLSSADWAMEMIADSAVEKGVKAGKQQLNCDEIFENCRLTEQSFESMLNALI